MAALFLTNEYGGTVIALRAPAYDVFLLDSTRPLSKSRNGKMLLAWMAGVPRLNPTSRPMATVTRATTMIDSKMLIVILFLALIIFGTTRLRSIGADVRVAVKGFRQAMRESDGPVRAPLPERMSRPD
jgi:TatA/E family protein of Tat protein translocase